MMTTKPMPFFARRLQKKVRAIIERGEGHQYTIVASWWFVALLNRFATARPTDKCSLEGVAPSINVYEGADQIPVYKTRFPFFTYRIVRKP